jgi:hypothetical protein
MHCSACTPRGQQACPPILLPFGLSLERGLVRLLHFLGAGHPADDYVLASLLCYQVFAAISYAFDMLYAQNAAPIKDLR